MFDLAHQHYSLAVWFSPTRFFLTSASDCLLQRHFFLFEYLLSFSAFSRKLSGDYLSSAPPYKWDKSVSSSTN